MSSDDIIILTKMPHQRICRPYNTAVNLAELKELLECARGDHKHIATSTPAIRLQNIDSEDTVMIITHASGVKISFYAFHEHRDWMGR